LVLAFSIGAGGVAAAQGAAIPPPAKHGPPASGPAAGPPAAGAPATVSAASPTTVAPAADKPEPSAGLPPRVPWRGTSVSWTNAATTTLIGVGRDNISSSGETYTMDWSLTLNYYVVDQDKWKISLMLVPSVNVELTNSNITTTKYEPHFGDLPFLATYSRTLFAKGLWSTGLGLTSGLVFPTSPTSSAIGNYLKTTERLSLSQSIPLLGKDAPVLKSFALGLGARWDHRFGKATTAVSDETIRVRQDHTGSSIDSDGIGFSPLATNTLRESISLTFSEAPGGMPLSVGGSFSFIQSYLPEFEGNDCEVELPTGCVKAGSQVDVRTTRYNFGFSVSASFQPAPELGLSLAYANASNTLGTDGQTRSIFYSPGAQFSGTLTFYPDALYERLTGPPRKMAKKRDRKRRSF